MAVGYALILSLLVMRTLKLSQLPQLLLRAGISSAAILLFVGTATAFAWIATLSQVPLKLSGVIFSISENPYLLLFMINILLLIVGMFLDAGPAILILGPILAPTMVQLGIHPLHFAIIMCVNLTVGLATPPMGLILFVASGLTNLRVEVIAREMIPLLALEIAVIFLITYVPAISMTIPKLLGFY